MTTTGSQHPRTLTVGAVALVSLAAFEAIAVATAMPTAAAALHDVAGYALAFGLPLATSVVGMVVSGIWSDAHGPGMPIRAGVLAFVIGLVLAGCAPTMTVLATGRAVQGLGSGLFSVALYVVVGRAVAAEHRPRIFAAFAAAWVLPSLVGPPVAGLIVERWEWRWVFLLAAVLAVPAALLVDPTTRRLGPPADASWHGRYRIGWAVGAAAGAVGLHLAGQQPLGPLTFLLGAASLGVVAVTAPRLLPAGTGVARVGLPAVVALRGLVAATFLSTEVFVPLLLSRERGLSPTAAGLVLTSAALSWASGSWLQGRVGTAARPTLLRAGTAAVALGVAATATAVVPVVPVAVAVVAWAVAGLGMGLVYPALSVLTLELSTPAEQGTNSSALQIAEALCTATVLALSGALFAALIATGPLAYVAGFAVPGGLGVVAVMVAGRARPPALVTVRGGRPERPQPRPDVGRPRDRS